MTTFLLIRHGLSQTNKNKCYTGQSDVPLDDLGVLQGRLVSEYIYKNYEFDEIYSSDLSRAINTILPLSELSGKKIHKTQALRELDMGKWVGVSFEDIKTLLPEEYEFNKKNPLLASYTGGENYPDFTKRVIGAIDKIASENSGKTVVVATHAGVVRSFLRKYNNISDKETNADIIVPNASITVFTYESGNVEFKNIGITEHLKALDV